MSNVDPPKINLENFIRLSSSLPTISDSLGPLSHLLGTWVGNKGWNLIAVPNPAQGFLLLVRPYYESITFSSIGAPAPNRGGTENLFVTGLQYELRVTDAETSQPLHIETGMWLFLNPAENPGSPPIVRQSVIPHGDSLLALGNYFIADGPPKIPDIDALPVTGAGAPLGYVDPYLVPMPEFNKTNPNKTLQDAIKDQDILRTITLDVSTENSGGIVNIPFIVKNANASAFQAQFWIEKVKDKDSGAVFEQLQYSQQTNLNFLPRFDNPNELIMWPHVNINTLVKQ